MNELEFWHLIVRHLLGIIAAIRKYKLFEIPDKQ